MLQDDNIQYKKEIRKRTIGNIKKISKIILIIILEALVMFFCGFLGFVLNHKNKEDVQLKINKIALVNLDDGVEIDGATKYYSSDFTGTLKDNFEVTGLEQARQGLTNNLYAAYIIIPASFSKNVESINTEPVKSSISFKMNNNLAPDVKESVVADITNFNSGLSTNMEYVYLDAVLREVHNVQNGAEKLLENDLSDLEQVLKFTESDMIVDPEYPTLEHAENNISDFDLTKIYRELETAFNGLALVYNDAREDAQKEYNGMLISSSELYSKMVQVETSMNQFGDLDNEALFDIENSEELSEFVDEYNGNLQLWQEDYNAHAVDKLNNYMTVCNENVKSQVADLEMKEQEHLTDVYLQSFLRQQDNEVQLTYDIEIQDAEQQADILVYESSAYNCVLDYLSSHNATPEEIENFQLIMENALITDFNNVCRVTENKKNQIMLGKIQTGLKDELISQGAEDSEMLNEDIRKFIENGISEDALRELMNRYYQSNMEIVIDKEFSGAEQENTESKTTEEDLEQGDLEEVQEDGRKEYYEEILFADAKAVPSLDGSMVEKAVSKAVIAPISDLLSNNYMSLQSDYSALNTFWEEYDKQLNAFSINSFVDGERSDELLNYFDNHIGDVESAVIDKGTEYYDYVRKSNELNDNNLQGWEESIEKANQETHSNVEGNIKDIRANRESTNQNNKELMNGIINVLPYTKLGELENRKVYSYMTNPIECEDLTEKKQEAHNESEENQKSEEIAERMILVIGLLLCLIGCVLLLRFVLKRDKRLNKQDLL